MKRFYRIVLALVMLCCLTACGKDTNTDTADTAVTQAVSENTETVAISGVTDAKYLVDDPDSQEAKEQQDSFEKYLDELFEETVTSDTLTLHYSLADPKSYGITPKEVSYGQSDLSKEGIEKERKKDEDWQKRLRDFDYDLLTGEQRLTYDILDESFSTSIEYYDYIDLYEPFAYTSGLQSNMPITLSEYTFYDSQDVEDYLTLLELTPDYFSVWLEFEKEKSDKGYFMSSNSANEVIRQCTEYIAQPEKNLLIETFDEKVEAVPGLDDEQIADYKEKNYDAVMNYIIPAYRETIEVFKQLRNTGKNQLGLCYLPNGKEYYSFLLRSKVGTDMTPEEIIELLDKKISDAVGELSKVALKDYEGYMNFVNEYESLYEDVQPKETIEYFEEACSDCFPSIPEIDFTITPVHESLENIVSPAFFVTPPLDDYAHNVIHTNLNSKGASSIWGTLAHEGVPGHMYQFVYFLSKSPAPIRTLLNFNGYQEGWATYVEQKSFGYYENYKNDCYADLERLNSSLNLLISARIEIGVNYQGWTKDDVSGYMTGKGFDGSAAEDVMKYVIAEPANYQMYVMGWQELEELKDKYEKELGGQFDEVEFHRAVLEAGPCQFGILKDYVAEYMNNRK